MEAIPRKAHCMSLHKWRKLLGLLHSITPAVAGSRGMFIRVKNDLKSATGRHVQLTMDMHSKLKAWRKLVCSLSSRPTHLRKLQPFLHKWIRTTHAFRSGMGGLCREP